MDLKSRLSQNPHMAQKAPNEIAIAQADNDELAASLTRFDVQSVEDELQAHNFCQAQLRKIEAEQRLDRTENMTTEVLEIVTSPAVGAISTIKTKRNFPIGALVNYMLGVGAKGLAVIGPEQRALRVIANVGKVMLHGQLAITTHNIINK